MLCGVSSKYIEREREQRRRVGGEGGEEVVYIPLPNTHTHTHPTHTLYIITIIFKLNEGFKHCASLHCLFVADVDF